MKKFFMLVMVTLSLSTVNAQDVVREGKKFSVVSSRSTRTKKDTLVTEYTFDSGAKVYPIIINKNSGRCYIWKISSKTGKLYKFYMKEQVSRTISKELNITYVEKD